MSSSNLIRWSGLAAVLSGVAWVVQGLLALTVADPDTDSYLDVLFIVAVLFALVGLAGLHAVQKGSYGWLGRAGLYTIIVASVAQIVGLVVLLTGSEALIGLLPLGGLGVLVGFILYGVATLQARVLPRWCGVGITLGLPVIVLLGDRANVLFGLLWLALGYVLLTWGGAVTGRPSRVS